MHARRRAKDSSFQINCIVKNSTKLVWEALAQSLAGVSQEQRSGKPTISGQGGPRQATMATARMLGAVGDSNGKSGPGTFASSRAGKAYKVLRSKSCY